MTHEDHRDKNPFSKGDGYYYPSSTTWPSKKTPAPAGLERYFKNKPLGNIPAFEGLPEDWTPASCLNALSKRVNDWEKSEDEGMADLILIYGLMLTDLLLRKNERYGNSVGDPVSVFSKDLDKRERMRVRMDDKISRIMRGGSFGDKEDPRVDLAGYLILDLIMDMLD